MTNSFEQGTPRSIDRFYRGLPLGPDGIAPLIRIERQRRNRARGKALGRAIRRVMASAAARYHAWRDRPAADPIAVRNREACCQGG